MKKHYAEVFQYNYLVNRYYIGLLLDKPIAKSYTLISHIINAQLIWNARISGEALILDPWKVYSMEELAGFNKSTYKATLKTIEEDDFDRVVTYKNSKGEEFTNTIADILFHLTNHSTHHRAQVGAEFKAKGMELPATDYVVFKRK